MKILGEFKTSVEKALSEIDPKWKEYNGLIVCGTHTPYNSEQMIDDIQKAREQGAPFFGICFGHQLAAIEYARNVLGIKNAQSEELQDTTSLEFKTFVVKKLPVLKVGQHDGETYWNNFEVVPEILKVWQKPDNFITCQFHPEYQSSREKPHPLLLKFLYHAKNAK